MMKDAIHSKLDEHVKGSYCARSLLLVDLLQMNDGASIITVQTLYLALSAGVVDVEVVMSKDAPGTGRGFCFVEFYNHSAAAHAKGVLGGENFRLRTKSQNCYVKLFLAYYWLNQLYACVNASELHPHRPTALV